jgi:5-methylcytosine-specific restriction protein A
LDVGRAVRTVPDGLRRAVAARDRGCAFPGCDRPPSWADVHHVIPWEEFGATALRNCVMLCRFHHRLLHSGSGWVVRICGGRAEFVPPKWVDRTRTARRKPPPGNRHRASADLIQDEMINI